MHRFTWTFKDIEIGLAEFDRGHEALLALLNPLCEAIIEGEAPRVQILFAAFEFSIEEHFLGEETMMRNAGYPGLADHRREHLSLTKELADAGRRLGAAANKDADFHLATRLGYWFAGHVLNADARFAEFYRSRPSPGSRRRPRSQAA